MCLRVFSRNHSHAFSGSQGIVLSLLGIPLISLYMSVSLHLCLLLRKYSQMGKEEEDEKKEEKDFESVSSLKRGLNRLFCGLICMVYVVASCDGRDRM